MNITKEIKTIRTEAEKKLGYPLVEKFWDVVEDDVGDAATNYDGDPEGQEAYIESYRNVTERYVMALSTVPSIKVKSSIDGNGEKPNPKKIYRKCFERRFYLVHFTNQSWARDHEGSVRFNWKRILDEWNKAHPSDTMSLSVLKVEYYRAIEENGLVIQLLVIAQTQENEREDQRNTRVAGDPLTPSEVKVRPYSPSENERVPAISHFIQRHGGHALVLLYKWSLLENIAEDLNRKQQKESPAQARRRAKFFSSMRNAFDAARKAQEAQNERSHRKGG